MTVLFALFAAAPPTLLQKFAHGAYGILVFLLVLGFMVLVHEAGHFFAAKWSGVRVEAFAIGFGKRLFGVVRNGTDYRINALPLGGYVKMAGQDEMPAGLEQTTAAAVPTGLEPYNAEVEKALGGDDERAFVATDRAVGPTVWRGVKFTEVSRGKRMLIGFAGPLANFVLALVVLLFVNLFHYEQPEFLQGPAVVDYVPTGSAAAAAGLVSGDTVTSLNGHSTPDWQNAMEQAGVGMRNTVPVDYLHGGLPRHGSITLTQVDDPEQLFEKIGLIPREQTDPIGVLEVNADTPAARAGLEKGDRIASIDGLHLHDVIALRSYLQDTNGKAVTLQVLRDKATLTLHATPEMSTAAEQHKQYLLGFRPMQVRSNIVRLGFTAALAQSWKENVHFSALILQILRGLFTHQVSVKNMSGPVGIEQQVSEAADQGFWDLMHLTAGISLNLGIFNLLPMPILDGGLILFLLIESIARRDVKPAIKERVYQAAFVCIVVFFCFVMWNDISRLVMAHRPD